MDFICWPHSDEQLLNGQLQLLNLALQLAAFIGGH